MQVMEIQSEPAKEESKKKKVAKKESKEKSESKSEKKVVKEESKKSKSKEPVKKDKVAKKDEKTTKEGKKTKKLEKHLPALEDGEGFDGRRPIVEPLRVGEKAVYRISYFAVEAGRFTMEIKPFVKVNDQKAYHFHFTGRTSSVFSLFYAVDDSADAYLDYEKRIPYSYEIHVKESKQVREVRSYFDWKTMTAETWDKKLKKGEKKPQKEHYKWKILPYSQNVFTVAFYLRHFQLDVGKKLAVRVAHEGKNLIMRAKVLRKERLKTTAGTFDTVVVRPRFEIDGMFKQVGEISIWLTDDDRKHILRIESKIKIGTIVAAIHELHP